MSGEDQAVGEPERLHPLFILTGFGGSLRGMTGAYAAVGYFVVSGQMATALIVTLAMMLFLGISLLLYWLRFEYRVGESEIRIDSGLFSRTHRSIPFDRIHDVDITQGPVARLTGLAKVKFETGSAAGKDDEGVLQAITLDRAQELRSLVRARRSGVADTSVATAAESEAEGAPVFAMGLKRVLLAGMFNFSLALFAGLFGATQTFGEVAGFDPLSRTFWRDMLSAGDPIADFLLAHRVGAAFAGVLLLILAGLLTGVVRTALRDYGFRLDRVDVGLRRRRGLLTRTDVTLPRKRAQAAIVGSGPVRDAFGWRDLKVQSLARDEAGSGDHVLAPLASDAEVAGILAQLGWRAVPDAVAWRRVSRAYIWAFAAGLSPLLLVVLVQLAVFPAIGAALAFVLAAAVALRALAWKRTRFALDEDRLLIATGWWRRRLLIVPKPRIQSIDLTESFVSRAFGTATLTLGIAGGSGFAGHSVPSLPRESARQLREELLVSQS